MVQYSRKEILLRVNYPSLRDINLQWIFKQNQDTMLQFLAHHKLIKNSLNCKGCEKSMSFSKRASVSDGFEVIINCYFKYTLILVEMCTM